MAEPHHRWSRATEDHATRIKAYLCQVIDSTGRPLSGGVTKADLKHLPLYDTLDLAQGEVDGGRASGLAYILNEARTPPASPEE